MQRRSAGKLHIEAAAGRFFSNRKSLHGPCFAYQITALEQFLAAGETRLPLVLQVEKSDPLEGGFPFARGLGLFWLWYDH